MVFEGLGGVSVEAEHAIKCSSKAIAKKSETYEIEVAIHFGTGWV